MARSSPREFQFPNSKYHNDLFLLKMRLLRSLVPSLVLVGAGIVSAASSWSFDEAIVSVSGKTAGGFKDKYVA